MLKRQTAGQPFTPSAGTWNAFCDAAEKVANDTDHAGRGGPPPIDPFRRGVVYIKNTTETAWDRFTPVGIKGPLLSFNRASSTADVWAQVAARMALEGEALDHEKHAVAWVVTLEPIGPGAIGMAAASGIVPCRVKHFGSSYFPYIHAACRFVQVRDAEETPARSVLAIGTTGTARILWREPVEDKPDYLWALLELGCTQQVALFQLTEAIQMPGDAAHGVPFTENARRVLYIESPDYPWASGYGHLDWDYTPETIHFPTYRRRATGVEGQSEPWGMPPLATGERVHCIFNIQAFRWEAIEPAMRVCRFEMTASLISGAYAYATPYWYDDEGTRVDGEGITVYDANEKYSKMATTSGDTGALGIAQWMPDKSRWEIVDMQTPGDFWGTLEGDMHKWDGSMPVRVWTSLTDDVIGVTSGYNVFQANHGLTITVHNVMPEEYGGMSGREDGSVFCKWNTKWARYEFAFVEPSDLDWPMLDVVTRTSLSINFNAQTFQHRHFTRRIKLPPWTEIGPEVERW